MEAVDVVLTGDTVVYVEVVMRSLIKNTPRYTVAALTLTVLAILSGCGGKDKNSTNGLYGANGFYGGCIPLGQPISFQGQVTTSLRTFWSGYGGSTYGYYIQAATQQGSVPTTTTPVPTTPTTTTGVPNSGMYYGAVNVLTIGAGGYGYTNGQALPDRLPDGPNRISVQLSGSYGNMGGMNSNASINGTLQLDPYSLGGGGSYIGGPYAPAPGSPTSPTTPGMTNGQVCVQGMQLKIGVTAQSGQPIAAQADLILSNGQRRTVTINPYFVSYMY